MTTKSPIDRIKQIQEAHSWMLEREARGLLVAIYAALTNGQGLREAEEIQEQMNIAVEHLCQDSRKGVEKALSKLPPRMFDHDNDYL